MGAHHRRAVEGGVDWRLPVVSARRGKLAATPRVPDARMAGMVTIMAVMGVVLPQFGASLPGMFLFDQVLRRRIFGR